MNEIIATVCVAEKSVAVNGKSEADYETLDAADMAILYHLHLKYD